MVFRLSTTFTRITAALIRGRRTLTLFVSNAALIQGRRSYGGGAHSSKYGILGVIRVFLITAFSVYFPDIWIITRIFHKKLHYERHKFL